MQNPTFSSCQKHQPFIGAAGFEPATPSSQTRCATRLRHAPMAWNGTGLRGRPCSLAPMADVQPLRALHYDLAVTGPLQDLATPPYDVIDPAQRAALAARSPYNAVHVDLPEGGEDVYATAAEVFARWRADGGLVLDDQPAIWALVQEYTGPDGRALTRRGLFARVGVEEYGAGRIRPHERTHPGPKEDRLRLTRATKANLSPIFALYDDPAGAAWGAVAPFLDEDPFGTVTDADGTHNRLWRIADPAAIAQVQAALAPSELLIADGHHRYETARVYRDEPESPAGADHVLMCLVALQDDGLTVFPTHRLVKDVTPEQLAALADVILAGFDVEDVELSELRPPDGDGPLTLGFIDHTIQRPRRLTLKDQATADAVLPGKPEAYRHLDTAVLEALLLTGPLELTEDDISHLHRFGYSRTDEEALELVQSGAFDLAFFLRGSPVQQVRDVAATGVNMPPKSTFFFPKVPTGLLYNPLDLES
jgi:uncharacterized protein (DUF1015 family)